MRARDWKGTPRTPLTQWHPQDTTKTPPGLNQDNPRAPQGTTRTPLEQPQGTTRTQRHPQDTAAPPGHPRGNPRTQWLGLAGAWRRHGLRQVEQGKAVDRGGAGQCAG